MKFAKWLNWHSALTWVYCMGVAVVQLTLEGHPDPTWRLIYLLFAPAMLLARFSPNARLGHAGAVGAVLLLVVGGVFSPLELEVIEESFILVPLFFLMLYPGKGWAMAVAGLLLVPYLLGSGGEELPDIIEDAAELLVIAGFASVMTYYQQRSYRLMLGYREESRTDYLTRLKNRFSYSNALKGLEHLPSAEQRRYALLLIDLDDFKRVNDLLGHGCGDQLLRQFAQRLERLGVDRTYRIGGDEFAILLRETAELQAAQLVETLRENTRRPYLLHHRTVSVSSSIGIARYDPGESDSEHLVRNADLALFQSKAQGKNRCNFFEQSMLEARMRQDRLARDMRQAIADQQFFVMYQPKVDMTDGRIVGAEALVRWQHPELGLILPADFIAIAESTRLIVPLGRWVLEQACLQAVEWQRAGCPICVSVNVSSIQLEYDALNDAVREILSSTGLSANLLEIEITESTIMGDIDFIIPLLQELRALGIGLAVDDFGVAYSSLNQLTRLPLTVLKIDRSFVENCHTVELDRVMVRSIIQLANNLDMDWIAEGVELKEQREVLLAEGCVKAQGYLYHRPLSSAALWEVLAVSDISKDTEVAVAPGVVS